MTTTLKLELSKPERDQLVRMLETYHRDMRVELRRTEGARLHEELAAEDKMVSALLERLRKLD